MNQLGVVDVGDDDPAHIALGKVVHHLFLHSFIGYQGILNAIGFQIGQYLGVGGAPAYQRVDGHHALPGFRPDELKVELCRGDLALEGERPKQEKAEGCHQDGEGKRECHGDQCYFPLQGFQSHRGLLARV